MTEKFNTLLEPYKDSNNKQIKGKYHFQLLEELEKGCYPMNLEYESTDPTKAEAYQYNGYIVVGNRCYLTTSPIIIPFNTTAATEEEISVTEKLNTQFNAVVNAFSDSELEDNLGNLPYYIHIVKGEFKDYWADSANAKKNINTDFENGYELPLNFPLSTGNNGVGTNTVKVKDIYDTTETVHDLNTIIFKCKGTRDRGSNNYVPAIIEAPLIIGTTDVKLINKPQDTDTLNIDGTVKTVAVACGRGVLELHCNVMYKFATHTGSDNYGMKYGYDEYLSDSSKYVRCGGLQLQYKENDTWIPVPKSQLTAVDSNTTINSDGIIYQTPGHETGGIKVRWTNPFSYMTSNNKDIQYRWKYIGKVGETRGLWTGGYDLRLDRSYGSPVAYDSRIVMNESTFIGTPNTNVNVCGKLQMKDGNSWVDTNMGQGTVTVDLGEGTPKTATVNSDGTFCVTINVDGGEYDLDISYHDTYGVFEDATETSSLVIESTGTRIIADDEFFATRGQTKTISGKIVSVINGTQHDITNGTGVVTVKIKYEGTTVITKTANVNSDGTFTTPSFNTGAYSRIFDVQFDYEDESERYAPTSKISKLYVKYGSQINLNSNSINVLIGDSYSISGSIDFIDADSISGPHLDSYFRLGDVAESLTNSLNANTFTINSDGTFTITGTTSTAIDTTVTLSYAGNKAVLPSTTQFDITSDSSDVHINSSKTHIHSYDTGTSDSDNITLTLTDDYGNPVKKGNVKLYAQPTNDEYKQVISVPQEVANITVPSTGIITLNSYDLATETPDFMGNLLYYTRYALTVKYTDSTGIYNQSNKFSNEIEVISDNPNTSTDETMKGLEFWYQVQSAKLKLKVMYRPHSTNPNAPYTTPALYDQTITSFGNDGDVSPPSALTIPNNSDIKVEFSVLDSNNNRIANVGHHSWVTHQNDLTGYCSISSQGVRYSCSSDAKRTYREYTYNPDGTISGYVERETATLKDPTYAGIALIEDESNLNYSDNPLESSNTNSDSTLTFTLWDELVGGSTLFVGLTKKAAAGIFKANFSNVEDIPSLSLVNGVSFNSQMGEYYYTTPVPHTYGVIFNITFDSQPQ